MRKLGRPTDQRIAMLKSLTTDLLKNGKITTTEQKAKEVKKIADKIINLAIKEKDNFEEVEVKTVKAKLDSKGNKVTEKVTSKNGKEYSRVVKVESTQKVKKDSPSRLHARKQIIKYINKLSDVDILEKLFDEIAPRQKGRVGGYTRIIKKNPRRGDNADMAILEIL